MSETKLARTNIDELDKILGAPINVLDHGFIRAIDYMGSDDSIVQAARVSYGSGTKKVSQDRALINYLMRHRHTTPFEMCEIKFHLKMPIFVARQWIRHRTASVNEYSARYSILGKEFYMPRAEHLSAQSVINKQGRENNEIPEPYNKEILDMLRSDAGQCYKHYEQMLNQTQQGDTIDENRPHLTRELARMNLTLNYYTEFYWKIDLHNLLHFLSLRADSHAQYEIRVYAEKMLDIVKLWTPMAYDAFTEYKMGAAHLSVSAMRVVKDLIAGKKNTREHYGIGKREWAELMEQLGINE